LLQLPNLETSILGTLKPNTEKNRKPKPKTQTKK